MKFIDFGLASEKTSPWCKAAAQGKVQEAARLLQLYLCMLLLFLA